MTLSRRDILKGGAVAFAASPFVITHKARASTTISYVDWGGRASEIQRKAWAEPFTKETGIGVTMVAGPDLAKVKAQVDSNNVLWDVVGFFGLEAAKEGLAEPLDQKVINPEKFVVKPTAAAAPVYAYVGGVGFDPNRSKSPPRDFAQFWNADKFPGSRGLRSRVSETLEMALLADGVSPDKLYPLDIERGFGSLDRIKPYVKKWFAETAQGVSLIQTGEVNYTYTYLNRVLDAKNAGISIDFSSDQNIIGYAYAFVPKGTPRKVEAMRFLDFITRPQQQIAMLSEFKGLFPGTKGVYEALAPQIQKVLPAPDNPKLIYQDGQYWGDHFTALDRRFKEWTLT